MSTNSAIEWTDATWNPTTGCTKVSPACANCYIERTPPFRMNGRRFVKGHIPLKIHDNRQSWPQGWKQPRRIFVNSLSDLFHQDVPDQTLHDTYYTMENRAPWHVYQVLTKRSKRMAEYLQWRYGEGRVPSRHIWHGVSVENASFTWRIDDLRAALTRIRFLSIEPILGDLGVLDLTRISWVIVGGESGPRSRAPQAEWIRSVRDQCVAAGVPFFFKQWGGARPKSGGRILDGRTWDEMPNGAR
jgi:protein gp37